MAKADQKALEDGAPRRKSKMKLILVVILAAVAAAGGFFVWRYIAPPTTTAHADEAAPKEAGKGAQSATHDADSEHPQVTQNAIINFEPFLVNLADNDAFRYLRVTIRVAVTNKEKAEQIVSTDVLGSKIRDAILNMLSSKASSEIITPEGKEQLKTEIMERLNSFLPDKPVLEVFFADFVVQL